MLAFLALANYEVIKEDFSHELASPKKKEREPENLYEFARPGSMQGVNPGAGPSQNRVRVRDSGACERPGNGCHPSSSSIRERDSSVPSCLLVLLLPVFNRDLCLPAVDASRCSPAIRFPPVFAIRDRCRFGFLRWPGGQPPGQCATPRIPFLAACPPWLVVTASNHAHSVADWHLTSAVCVCDADP